MQPVHRNLYGRRKGPKLRRNLAALMRDKLGEYAAIGPDRSKLFDVGRSFPAANDVWLEVGFGAGEHVISQAERSPDVGILACEHYLNGVAVCLARIEEKQLDNVRLHHGDARDLIDLIPDATIGRVFLLYPDPWPKSRHHKRRFINPENLDAFARVMRDNAELRVASDIPDYIEWTLEHLNARSDFVLAVHSDEAWPDWLGTRYEAKALREGRKPAYLSFTRLPR